MQRANESVGVKILEKLLDVGLLVAAGTLVLSIQTLLDAISAEGVSADGGATFFYEREADWADEFFIDWLELQWGKIWVHKTV